MSWSLIPELFFNRDVQDILVLKLEVWLSLCDGSQVARTYKLLEKSRNNEITST